MRNISCLALDAVPTSSSATSSAIPVTQMTEGSVIITTAGDGALSGSVKIQASNDISTGFPVQNFVPTNWVDVTNATVNVSGNGTVLLAPFAISYQYVRVVFTRSAGTGGTLTAAFSAGG